LILISALALTFGKLSSSGGKVLALRFDILYLKYQTEKQREKPTQTGKTSSDLLSAWAKVSRWYTYHTRDIVSYDTIIIL